MIKSKKNYDYSVDNSIPSHYCIVFERANPPWRRWHLPIVLPKDQGERASINSWLSYLACGETVKCGRHIEPNLQNPDIGGLERIHLKKSGSMFYVGYSRIRILRQRICLDVSRVNILDASLTANSGPCNVESKNGEPSWQENLCMLVLGSKNFSSCGRTKPSPPWGRYLI